MRKSGEFDRASRARALRESKLVYCREFPALLASSPVPPPAAAAGVSVLLLLLLLLALDLSLLSPQTHSHSFARRVTPDYCNRARAPFRTLHSRVFMGPQCSPLVGAHAQQHTRISATRNRY